MIMTHKTFSTSRRHPEKMILLPLVAALMLGACANMDRTDKDTAKGAGIGAVAGAVLGGATGGRHGANKGAVIGSAIGAIGGNIWSRNMQEKQSQMETATKDTGVQVSRTDDNQLKLEVPADISFATNSAAIELRLRSVLEQFASGLNAEGQNRTLIRIIGHTDSRGGDAINNPLSMARADSVKNFLSDRGVASHRIETSGRGAREPIASNDTEAGRARNRRVEIFLREPEG